MYYGTEFVNDPLIEYCLSQPNPRALPRKSLEFAWSLHLSVSDRR